MKIAFGCDHRGYILKDAILAHLRENGHEVVDMGTDSTERVDYPVYGEKVGRAVASGEYRNVFFYDIGKDSVICWKASAGLKTVFYPF